MKNTNIDNITNNNHRQQQQHTFRNPWDYSNNSSNVFTNNINNTTTTINEEEEEGEEEEKEKEQENQDLQLQQMQATDIDTDDDTKYGHRRKSSLIVPPTRAAGPDPYLYQNNYLGNGSNIQFVSSGPYSVAGATSVAGFASGNNLNNTNANIDSYNTSQNPFNNFNFQSSDINNVNNNGLNFHFNFTTNPVQNFRRQSVAGTYLPPQQHPSQSGVAADATNASLNINNNNNNNNNNRNYQSLRRFSIQQQQQQGFLVPPPSTAPTNLLAPPYKQLLKDSTNTVLPTSSSSISPTLATPATLIIPTLKPVSDLCPHINTTPLYRRASLHSKTVSPLNALTTSLTTTYSLCSSDFRYQTSKNPRRVLTKPSDPINAQTPWDNCNSDYILYVNDLLGDGSTNVPTSSIDQNIYNTSRSMSGKKLASRKYLVLDILGQGTFGQVVKCQNLLTKEIVAIKIIRSRPEYLNPSFMECKILEILHNKCRGSTNNFLQMKDSFMDKGHLCLVFELLGNNLYELLKQNKYHGLSLQLITIFTKQILESLVILKDNKIIHCDLKPENILLISSDKPDLKIIDFGSACEETQTVYTYIQSRFYRAPEVLLGLPYSTGIDMWSVGCIVAELYLGIPIFPGCSELNQITRIVEARGYPPKWMLDRGKNTLKFFKINPNYVPNALNSNNNTTTTTTDRKSTRLNSSHTVVSRMPSSA
ncbi:uncharacterized protein SCODWIG_02755 [Saccharomycodes ludwigii]|uniref:Protein kinase domain-containing protein n=1 Tax=Saccharomycodes ludwigii TaxID=36035 RepID=A0A376B8Z3_9ASCO|nr:uncharacterized protein SCODWIG_02755 [Saccharomycodes ludwigii]